MSGSGFRGRGFGPRSNRPQKPHGGFSGPHPNFNQNRRPPPNHQNFNPNQGFGQNRRPGRPPGPDGWRDNSERFNRHPGNGPQFQGHNQGHPRNYYNNGPGNYHGGFRPARFPGSRARGPIRDSERSSRDSSRESNRERDRSLRYSRDGEKRNFFDDFQEPLLGSEEERQQKISKTVDKLKQTLSSFTEEDSINFWEDNFSPPSPGAEDPSTSQKGIPELRHGPPELDLTFNDFKVIGRVDLDSSFKSDSGVAGNEQENTVFNGSSETSKTGEQGPREDDPFGDDCLYLDDPQEEAFIAELDTRIADCDINFPKPTTSKANDVSEFNNQNQLVTEINQSEEFLVTEKIISEFQIEERSELLCENSPNLQFDIDPSFAENITDPLQNELSNFKDGSIFDPTIESNFVEPIEGTEATPVPFEAETIIDDQQILDTDLQDTDFQFEKSEHSQDEIQLQTEFQEGQFISDSPQSNQVQLFTAFESAEPPSEILQEESQHSNLPFEQQQTDAGLNIEMEPPSDILQNPSELQDLQSAFDQSQMREQGQIFDSTEALPGLSQQESNLFFEQLDQMEGNFPQPEQESSFRSKEDVPDQCKVSENEELTDQSKERDSKNISENIIHGEESQHSFYKESQFQSCEETQHSNSFFDQPPEQNELSESQEPLQPPPMFELTELMSQYNSPNSSDSFKAHKKPLEPPPMFDPMEAFPDLLQECEDQSNTSFHSHNLQKEPLQPPPMFELEEPPDFLQECDDSKSNMSIKRSKKLDHREESQHSSSSFDQQKQHSQEEILQPPPAFDPRGPPPSVTIVSDDRGFKSLGFEEVIQPPKVFDPRLTSHQRMDFVSSSGPDIVPPSWGGGIADFNMAPNFVPPMHVPSMTQPTGFIPNVGYGIAPVIPPMAPAIPLDFPPPLPQDNQAPPPLPADPPDVPESLEMLNMEDELEEMQEAMEFATQLMNMTESNGDMEMGKAKEKKSKKTKDDKNKDSKKDEKKRKEEKHVEYGPAPFPEIVPEKKEAEPEEGQQNVFASGSHEEVQVQPPLDPEEEGVFTDDQIRPKVVFNLNKVKRICKVDEWQQQQQPEDSDDVKVRKKKLLKDKTDIEASNSAHTFENHEENTVEDKRRRRRRSKDKRDEGSNRLSRDEKLTLFSRNEEKPSTSSGRSDEKQDSHKKGKKQETANQELWRNRVINQFLKMSKNDINNMINNTGLRRFDMAMKQLVKERKSTMSQEMRNTEEEKVRDYDGDQFMTQLSAMLDPGVRESVDITNLPTEFIQHLSVVLHLDPMPGVDETGGEMEMMDSDDFLQQMVMANKMQRTQEQNVSEEEYLHLPRQPSPTMAPPVIEKKRSRHHEKKIVHVVRVKDSNNQGDPHEQASSSRLLKDIAKSSRERENGEVSFRNSTRENQALREAQLREAHLRDMQIREQQAREQQAREQLIREQREQEIKEQQLREQQLREQQLREQQLREQQLREQQIREQQAREAREAKAREAKAREAKLREAQREAELREAAIREAEIKELKKKQAHLKAQLAREMLGSGSTTLDSGSPPHLTSVLDDIFKPGIPKGKSDRIEAKSKPNRSEVVTKPPGKYPTLGTMERTLDDIFCAGIAKAKASSKPASELSLEQQQLWTRKKRENVDIFRNLTKEEWEAKHGRSMSDSFEKEFNTLILRRTEAEALHSKGKEMNERAQKKTYQWDETPHPERINDENSERLLARQKEYLEDGELAESNDDSDNDCSSSSTSSSDSASSENIAPDVTKLLKVIKEREKVAKKKSVNETIRDEVAADIEKRKREKERHKERKSRKRKKREKKGKKRKRTRKHKKKTKRTSNSGSDREVPGRLLTEDEIKKEVKTEPISPEEKRVEKKVTIAVANKEVSTQATGVRIVTNSPAKVNVDYGQTKTQLMKTKAQLKQMPENTAVLTESLAQTGPNVAKPCTRRTNAETQTQTNAGTEVQAESHKSAVENKEVISTETKVIAAENKVTTSVENAEAIPAENKEKEIDIEKNLEKNGSDAKVPEITQDVEKKNEEVQTTSETAEFLVPEAEVAEVKAAEVKVTEAKVAETKTAESKTAESKVAETKTAEAKVAETKTAEAKVAEVKVAEVKVAEVKVTEAKVAEAKVAEAKVAEAKVAEAKVTEAKVVEPKVAEESAKVSENPETSKMDENKSAETSVKIQSGSDGEKKKRIGIQAYKARTLEREKKKREKLEEFDKNPISLTTDLLNIPLANKPRITESTTETLKINESVPTKSNSIVKEFKPVEIKKPAQLKNKKPTAEPKSSTALRDPRLASKAAQKLLDTPGKSSVNKLDPNKNKVNENKKDGNDEDENKFKFIKSEGGKELKLKNKPKSAKKIKNQSSPLVVIEQKIESPARRSSISSESDYSQGSSILKTSKTVEASKRKQEKSDTSVKKSKSDAKNLKVDPKADSLPKENVTKPDEGSKEKTPKVKQVSKEKASLEGKVPKEKAGKLESKKTENPSKEKEKPAYKPVRKLKIYGKTSKNETVVKKLISDGLPDTVPSEEIAKYSAMEVENYPNILQDLIEDPVDVCPAKEVFFGNMSLKEDDISEMKPTFESEDEQKSKQLEMEEINPMENIIFDGVVLDVDLQESNIVYSEINPCGLSPKTAEIFDEPDHDKPELFQFGIDESDQNLPLSSADLPPILTEEELELPLENVEKLDNIVKFTDNSIIDQLTECESDSFLIRNNLKLGIEETDFSKKEPEQTVQELFEPSVSGVEADFEKCNVQNSEFVNEFETNFEIKFENPAAEVAPSLLNHVGPIESRESGDLIQLIKETSHVELVDLQEKSSSVGESGTKIVTQEGEECAHTDLFTSEASRGKEEKDTVDFADNNKDSQPEFLESPVNEFVPAVPEISHPTPNFIIIPKDLSLALVSDADPSSVDKPRRDSQDQSYLNLRSPPVEVKSHNKPKKISEVVLQTGVTIVRAEKTQFEQSVTVEQFFDEKPVLEKSELENVISEKEVVENREAVKSYQENEVGKVQISAALNSRSPSLEVRSHLPEADSGNSKQEVYGSMGVKHTNQRGVDKALHKVKHKRKMKKKKEKKVKEEVKEALKQAVKPVTTQSLMARMKEIDDEIQKLMLEKLKLYKMMGNMEQNTESVSKVPENVASDVSLKENLGDLNGSKSEAGKKQKNISSPEDDEVAFFSKEQNFKDEKESVQNKEVPQNKDRSHSKARKAVVPSEDEEVAKISEKKSKKLTKTERSQSELRKNTVPDSSSEDEEVARISSEKKKNLAKTRPQSRMKKTFSTGLDSDLENIPLVKLKKLAERSQSRMKKAGPIDSDEEVPSRSFPSRSKPKLKSNSDDEAEKQERKMPKRPKSVMKVSLKSSSEDEAQNKSKKSLPKRPKSVMRLFSKEKSSDDDEKKSKKKIEMKRPKSAMKLTSKVTESSEVTSGDEEVAMLNLNNKKKKVKSPKTATEAMRMRPKSAMKLSTTKLIPSSEDESSKKDDKIKTPKSIEKSRKRPKSVMMKSSSKTDDSDEDQVKRKKFKEAPVLNTQQKIFVKIKGKHEREKSKKKESPEKKEIPEREKRVQIMENRSDDEKGGKKGKLSVAFVDVSRLDEGTKKKLETSSEAKKSEKRDKTKKANSLSPRKEKKDEALDKKHSRVKALDSALIYSDESTLEPLEPAKDSKLKKNSTGLALLEQSFRKEMAAARKAKADEKKKLKDQAKGESPEKEKQVVDPISVPEIYQKDQNEAKQETADQKQELMDQKIPEVPENIPELEKSSGNEPNSERTILNDPLAIPGPQDQTPCKGFDVSQKQNEDQEMKAAPRISDESQNSEKVREVSKNLFTEINEEESLNQEVQRINSSLEGKNKEPETTIENTENVPEDPKNLEEHAQEEIEKKKIASSSERIQEFSQPNFKEFFDKDSNRSALMSPISDDSTLSGDSSRKRKRPTRSLSRAGKSQTIRRSSRHQESEDEPEKISRAPSRQRKGSQTSVPDFEPPKKKKKVSEKVLYSRIKDLLRSEMRVRRKDKKKRKLAREEMENCKIKLVDLKHTYMKPELPQSILKRLGLSRINLPSKRNQSKFINSVLLQEEIMKMQEIRRISIEEPSLTSEGTRSSETTMYIFKLDQGKKLEAVKLTPAIEEESKPEKGNSNKKSTEEDKTTEEKNKLAEKKSQDKEKEKEKPSKEKEAEIEKPAKEKEQEKEKPAKEKEQEKEKSVKEKEKEKEKPVKEKEKEKEKPAKEKEKSVAKEKEKLVVEEAEKPVEENKIVEKETKAVESGEELMEVEERNPPGDADIQEEDPAAETKMMEVNGPNSEGMESQIETQTGDKQEDKEESQVSEHQDESVQETEKIEIPKIQYTVHKGPILDIKIIGDSFLAASEDGAIYRYSLTSNGILNIYKGHTHAVTCLYVLNPDSSNPIRRWMYSGSLDGSMRCYDIATGEQMQSPIAMGSAVQCMDQAWGAIFIGTTSGHVARYHIKAAALKGDRIQFSNKSVLALKATNEGPRKVLIVASRNQPITIRDAFTGLFLRQISGQKNYTVYSLLRHNNLIYFGTSSTNIPVYDFVTGEQKVQYNAGVGVVCMYLYERLLFAGCYDGNIYIFDIQKQKLVCSISGPGKMLLSMAIVNKRIIAGSKDKSLHCWEMPKQAQELLSEKT